MGACCSKDEDPSNHDEVKKEQEREQEQEYEEPDDDERDPPGQPHVFEEIVDAKHLKYMEHYEKGQGGEERMRFWGIGIENESYLEWSVRWGAESFRTLRPRRERYSVDYYKSFQEAPLEAVLATLRSMPKLTYPVWMNAHTFQKMDKQLQHRTFYDVNGTPNPAFGTPLHEDLLRECEIYRDTYDRSVVFDGDTIEFITQDYFCASTAKAVAELRDLKGRWIAGVGPWLDRIAVENGWRLPLGIEGNAFRFPERNEGLVTFLSTGQGNLGICNTQTLHLNFTLPTWLKGGSIAQGEKERFTQEHLTWVALIQVVEPLLAAVYGTPDVFSLVDPQYSMGSQRGTRSRYIGIQTYDTRRPVNGKRLLQPRPEDPAHWYNRLCGEQGQEEEKGQVPRYRPHTDIGYDVNVNKFKNHGIEIRFLDWFPEEHLQGVMDFFVLLGAHAVALSEKGKEKGVQELHVEREAYYDLIQRCLRQGCGTLITKEEQARIAMDLRLSLEAEAEEPIFLQGCAMRSPYEYLCQIKSVLWQRYQDSEVVSLMAPGGAEPQLVNYNERAYQELRRGVYGKALLVLRAEESVFEQRTPLVPADLSTLMDEYDVLVESSATRCFSDEAYRAVGATIIPRGTWYMYPHAVVVGLKGLGKGVLPDPTQTLFHFAHCFKHQEGWKEILAPLRRATFMDYEFMLNDEGRRTLSFCKQAGYVGAYLALMAYYGSLVSGGDVSFSGFTFSEVTMNRFLEGVIPYRERPRILLVGLGNVGQRAKEVLDRFSLEVTVKTRRDAPVTADEILSYDIYLHAIRLDVGSGSGAHTPFLTEADLDRERRLRLIVDLSCDLDHPANPLPIYHRYGTREEPVQRLRRGLFRPPLDLIAVPYLPSFDPVRSSVEFSSECVWYMSEVKWLRSYPGRNSLTRAMRRSLQALAEAEAEAEAL